MGDLVVVTGPPGAGKSTIAARVADAFDPSVLVEGDAFFGFLRRGAISPWLPESSAQNDVVTDAAAAATGRLSTLATTVYDGVLGPWYLPRFLAAAGTGCTYAVVLPTVEECLARVASRQGHGFTDPDATRRMHAEFVRGVTDLDPGHVVPNPAGDLDAAVTTIVAAHAARTLRVDPP